MQLIVKGKLDLTISRTVVVNAFQFFIEKLQSGV